jgi:hypothetical protein
VSATARPPSSLAAGDRIHARARHLYTELLGAVRAASAHIDESEVVKVADLAAGLVLASRTCNHPDCLQSRVQSLSEALAYAVIHDAAQRATTECGSHHG